MKRKKKKISSSNTPTIMFDISEVLKSITDGLVILDKSWQYRYVNKLAAKLLGKKKDELLGKNIWKEFPQTRKTLFFKKYHEAMRSQKAISFEYFYEQLKKWYQLHLYPSKKFLVIYFIDITALQNNREELKKYEDRLELAQKVGNIGIFELDRKSNQLWWSEQQRKLYGIDDNKPSYSYEKWKKVIHPDDMGVIQHEYARSLKEKRATDAEFRITLPSGDVRWIKGRSFTSFDEKGEPSRLVGVNFDITERKNLEQALAFKAEASKILSSALDYKQALRAVAKIAVPQFADWCVIDMLESEDRLENTVISHKNLKSIAFAERYRKKYPPALTEKTGIAEVLRTGKAQYYPLITDDILRKGITNPKQRALLQKIGFTSAIIVPLIVHGKPVGTISFITSESKRRFTTIDLQLAEQIASRASLAIENAMLYKEVNDERKRLHDLVSNVPGVVWEAYGKPDISSQRIDFVSDHVTTMLGYSVEEWLRTPNFWLTIVHPDDMKRAADESAAIYNSGKGGVSRFRWVHKNGKVIWVEAQSFVIKDEKEKPIGMRGVTMDITERMELEKRKDEFISMASHELKTPVTSLKVYTQLLQKHFSNNDDGHTMSHLVKMNRQIEKLTNLIRDLLDISRIETGKLTFHEEKIDLAELVAEVVDNIQQTTSHDLVVHNNVHPQIVGDRDRIGQVLINLLTNAMKYSKPTSAITVSVRKNGKKAEVSVQDYGIGISKEYQDKIFERFFQVTDSQEKTFPGLGIGLYISSEIVKRHRGEMWVESTKGKGSRFSFSLPISSQ